MFKTSHASNTNILTGNEKMTNAAGLTFSHYEFGFGAMDADCVRAVYLMRVNVSYCNCTTEL